MGAILPVLKEWAKEHFDAPTFKESQDGSEASFRFEHALGEVPVQVVIDVDERRSWLQFFAYLPFRVPDARRATLAAVLDAVNPRLPIGAFEAVEDGHLRYRSGMDVEGSSLGPRTLDNQVSLSLGALERFLPSATAAAFTEATVGEVLAASERKPAPPDAKEPAPPEPAARWVVKTAPGLDWSALEGCKPVRDWAQDWARHLEEGGAEKPEVLRLLGRGVLFVGGDREACEGVARLAASEAGLAFARVPAGDLATLPAEALTAFGRLAPILVFLEPGPWLAEVEETSPPSPGAERAKEVQKVLRRLLSDPDTSPHVVFVSAVGSLQVPASELLEVGAFDRCFAIPDLSPDVTGARFLDALGRERCAPSLLESPAKVGKMLAIAFSSPEERALAVLHLQRLAAREARTVEFVDLVQVYTRGFVEAASAQDNPESIRRQVATHEAGHAAVSVLDSQGANIPEFSTIIPSGQLRGVVVSSIMHTHEIEERTTWAAFRHMVRVALGGRAAEELVYGPSNVGNGAGTDLAGCVRLASRAFAEWGYAPAMESPEASRSNLAVVVGNAAPTEVEHVVKLVRVFLADEYTRVLALLQKHQKFLKAIADRLLVDPIVDQEELRAICKEHGVTVREDANADVHYGLQTGH